MGDMPVTATAAHRSGVVAPVLPRLLSGLDTPSLAAHLDRLGPLPTGSSLIDEVERAGLTGRGGAGFPTGRKLRAVAAGRGSTVVVANGTEGEPMSAKDRTLLQRAPHLVLDGVIAAAGAVGAGRAILCVERGAPCLPALRHALAERHDPLAVEVAETPKRYVAGQETALVRWLNGGDARPVFGVRPFESGVAKRPTLVDNVETLAHLGLIARFGASWYRELGTHDEPGSTLLTCSGGVGRPGVYEVAVGTPLADLLDTAGAAPAQAILFGGYFGRWVAGDAAGDLHLSAAGLAPAGARVGCGVVAVVPHDVCALDELARVAHWYAANSAGQCGVCVHGLGDIAAAVDAVAAGDPTGRAEEAARRWSTMVRGRGGCQLPDGAADFVETGLDALAAEVDDHRRGRCHRRRAGLLATPAPGGFR